MNLPILAYLALVSVLIPPAAGFYRWKTQNTAMKVFAVFCGYALIHTIIEVYFALNHTNNLFLSHYFTVIEFEVFIFIYSKRFTNKMSRNIAIGLGVLFLVFWVYYKFFFQDPTKFDDVPSTLSRVLLIVLSLMLLQNIFRDTSESLMKYSTFWIATTVVLYSSTTIIILAMSNKLLEIGYSYHQMAWNFNWAFAVIGNILYARSFWCKIF